MHTAKGCIEEIYLEGRHAARISCPGTLVPAPGQYLQVSASSDPEAALAQPVFSSGSWSGGFYAAPPLPNTWLPGAELLLRGPLGRGFSLPGTARRVALAAFETDGARLLALLEPALRQQASVTLLTNQPPANLPAALEIQPLSALPESLPWADYLAVEIRRADLPELFGLLPLYLRHGFSNGTRVSSAQVLVSTAMPCGGLAECGVCAVRLGSSSEYRLACKDGPVFDLE